MEGELEMMRSIRNKLIVCIFIGCLLPYFIGGIYLKTYIEKWLYESSIKNADELLYQAGLVVDKALIAKGERLVSMIAGSSEISNYGNNISGPSKLYIEGYFGNIKKDYSEINSIFLGLEDGSYIEYPEFTGYENYDPRDR